MLFSVHVFNNDGFLIHYEEFNNWNIALNYFYNLHIFGTKCLVDNVKSKILFKEKIS